MSTPPGTVSLPRAVALLERSISYTLGSLALVTDDAMSHPTPCRGWDLRALLVHVLDSVMALGEASQFGVVARHPRGVKDLGNAGDLAVSDDLVAPGELVSAVRGGAGQLLGAWINAEDHDTISVGGCPITGEMVAATGALELVVHGWNIAVACGQHRPIPASLARRLLLIAPLLVTDADRPVRFAAPVAVPPVAGPAQRLLAFLGRQPD